MKDYIAERARTLAAFILEQKTTVRAAAKKFNISKSTVHKDITERLSILDEKLAKQVHEVLAENKAERHIRGGLATREKYKKYKKEI